MKNTQCDEWLNEARWLAADAIQAFARFQPIADRYLKNPQVAAGLADPTTFSGAHAEIDASVASAAMQALSTVFATLTPEQSAAIYQFAATRGVPGR